MGDFAKVLRQAGKGDFVYMDPPFAVKSRRVFREYHPESFAESDVARLRRWLKILSGKGVHFVVSYAQSKEAEELAEGFDVRRVFVKRNIAGFTGSRARALELLISN
jgi:DNA adenine methylase